MSDEDREELTRGEGWATFERRMMNLFQRMAERVEAEAETSRRRDDELKRRAEEWQQRNGEELQRRNKERQRREEEFQRWNEETKHKIEFIVQQQAQFNADMQRLRELHEENERRWSSADERWGRTEGEIRGLLAIAEMHEREFYEMRQAQAEAQARTDARMAETGEHVDALVNTVERLISERRNGRGQREENPE